MDLYRGYEVGDGVMIGESRDAMRGVGLVEGRVRLPLSTCSTPGNRVLVYLGPPGRPPPAARRGPYAYLPPSTIR